MSAEGSVVVVGTPIGNLEDLSPRALGALAAADVICCEDTRHTRKLLTHAAISGVALVALHDHNELEMAPRMVARALAGEMVAVVSDAGMPAISDPGEKLVAAALAAGVTVTVIPGPSASITALVGSGLATGRFCFEGFLPRKGRERGERLAQIAGEERTVVLYEAPHRVARTLHDLSEACGGARRVAIARELTKRHEQRWSGTLEESVRWVAQDPPRGEWVVMVNGATPAPRPVGDDDLRAELAQHLATDPDRRAAVAAVAAAAGVPKRRVYQLALELRDRPSGP